MKGFKWENDRILRDTDVPGKRCIYGREKNKKNVLFCNEIQHREMLTIEGGFSIYSKEAGSAVINFTWDMKKKIERKAHT